MISSNQNRYNTFLVSIFLVAGILIAYEPVRKNDFIIYDDGIYITENPHVNQGLTMKSFLWAFTTGHSGNWHPLTWLSHILDCELFGLNPIWHHSVNLLLHIFNTLLLFMIFKLTTRALWQSTFVAVMFALHPLHVESVAWAAERKDVLSSLFWMLTILGYIQYVRKNSKFWYLIAVILFILGLMSKPMLVTLPFVLLLLDYWPLNRFKNIKGYKKNIIHLVIEKIPLFILAGISSVITFIVQKQSGALTDVIRLPLDKRLANVIVSYARYIGKMIWPAKFAPLYPLRMDIPSWKVMMCTVVLLVIIVIIVYRVQKKPYLFVGWFWYLGVLVPVIGFVQVGAQAMADRYTYLSSIGFFIIITWGINDLVSKIKHKEVIYWSAASVLILIMIILTRNQITYWKDSLTLCKRSIEVTENNYVMYDNYGRLLGQKGDFSAALQNLSKACTIAPRYVPAINNLGMAFKGLGKIDDAVKKWESALLIEPNDLNVNYNLGTTMMQMGYYDKAIGYFEKVLWNKPDFVEVSNKMSYALAVTNNQKLRNPVLAIEFAKSACELTNYKQPEFLDTLAVAYAANGDFKMALSIGEQAIAASQKTGNAKMIKEIRKHVELFKQKVSVTGVDKIPN